MTSSMLGNDQQTFPVQCSALRKNGFALLKGKPCKIVDMSTSNPGKHGHAKVHLTGLDLFTSKKVEDVCPSSHKVSVPEVNREEIMMINMSHEGYVTLLQDNGELDSSLKITKICDKTEEQARAMFDKIMESDDEGQEIVAVVLKAMGKMVIKDVKIRKAKN